MLRDILRYADGIYILCADHPGLDAIPRIIRHHDDVDHRQMRLVPIRRDANRAIITIIRRLTCNTLDVRRTMMLIAEDDGVWMLREECTHARVELLIVAAHLIEDGLKENQIREEATLRMRETRLEQVHLMQEDVGIEYEVLLRIGCLEEFALDRLHRALRALPTAAV
jgi:hypothetical protein